jgi:hypothetical protein
MGGAVEGLWEEEDEGRPGGHDAWDSSWTRGPDARVKAVRQCETKIKTGVTQTEQRSRKEYAMLTHVENIKHHHGNN